MSTVLFMYKQFMYESREKWIAVLCAGSAWKDLRNLRDTISRRSIPHRHPRRARNGKRYMTPPVSLILPSRLHDTQEWSSDSTPILITSETPLELITFAITFTQRSSPHSRFVIISTQSRDELIGNLTSTLLTSDSSPLNSSWSILASDRITIYHVETLAHLRVLLSSLQHSKVDFLGVDNFISLHGEASEMSAQGISRTFAAMISITSASNGVFVLREPKASIDRSVPILNAGVNAAFSQTTVPITRILGRWVRGFWNQETNGDGNCSAEWICRGEKWHIEWTLNDGQIDNVQMLKR